MSRDSLSVKQFNIFENMGSLSVISRLSFINTICLSEKSFKFFARIKNTI